MTEKSRTRITDVRTVGVPVTDQDRALEFYLDKLGFEKRADIPMGTQMRWLEVAPPGASTTVTLEQMSTKVLMAPMGSLRWTSCGLGHDIHWTLPASSLRGIEVEELRSRI